MKNILEICKDFGLEVPAEKHADFLKAVNEEYKTVSDYNKVVVKRDEFKAAKELAEETLKSFEGIDPAKVNDEIDKWKKAAEEAQQNAQKQLDERDFNDTLKAELDKVQFTSAAARRDVESQIRAAGLKHKDGVILGLTDLLAQIKTAEADAFVDERQQQLEGNKTKFAKPKSGNPDPGRKYSMSELMRMKNENPGLDIKQFLNQGGTN